MVTHNQTCTWPQTSFLRVYIIFYTAENIILWCIIQINSKCVSVCPSVCVFVYHVCFVWENGWTYLHICFWRWLGKFRGLSTKCQIIIFMCLTWCMFITRKSFLKEKCCWSCSLYFEVLYREVLFVMITVHYSSDQNRRISQATATGCSVDMIVIKC